MPEHPRVCGFVPARAGSKGIPNKNLAVAAGTTLLERAVRFAHDHARIDRCVVSTDGAQIAAEARRLGADVHDRPSRLAHDEARVIDAIRHFLDTTQHPVDVVVLLEPTSPLRLPEDLDDSLDALDAGADSAATFAPASLHPHRAFTLDAAGRPRPFLPDVDPWAPRQQLQPEAYELTGAIYAFWAARLPRAHPTVLFGTIHAVVVPHDRALDIDTEFDLRLADDLLS